MQEGRHAGVPDVVVLAVGVQTGGGAQGGVGSGEPASPRAAAADIRMMVAGTEKPIRWHRGTYRMATTGTVLKEEPIPMVTSRPIRVITVAATHLLPP